MDYAVIGLIGMSIVLPLASNDAHAEYRIMERAPSTHIVLKTDKCPRTPMFAPNFNEKVGLIVDGKQKTSGCWYEKHGEVYFTFQASGIMITYPSKQFRYIGPAAYDKKYDHN